MTNSASRWRILPQEFSSLTRITITWFLTDSHTKVTSPRTGGTIHLPLSLIFCAARVFWCDLKQILTRCSYKKLWKPTASTLSLRHGRTTKPKRTAKPWRETWGSPCHLYQLRSTWQWAALEVEAQQAACFLQYCSMSNVSEYVTYLLNIYNLNNKNLLGERVNWFVGVRRWVGRPPRTWLIS